MTDGADTAAAYAIRIEGVVGPLLRSCLTQGSNATIEQPSVVIVSVTDYDLVDVAWKLASYGLEIDSVRSIAVEPSDEVELDQVDAPVACPSSSSRMR